MIARTVYARSLPQPLRTGVRNAGKLFAYRRHVAILAVLLLVPALGAWAADDAPAQGLPPSPYFTGTLPVAWQFGIGYQYNEPYLRGAYPAFSTSGVSVSAVRYFTRFVAVEGDEGDGFGYCQPHQSFKSIFLGGGVHLAYHNPSRFEPWVHGLFGFSYYNFAAPQPVLLKDLALSWVLGGGVDYRLRGGFALRAEGDYLGTHFGGVLQANPQVVAGVVWNF